VLEHEFVGQMIAGEIDKEIVIWHARIPVVGGKHVYIFRLSHVN